MPCRTPHHACARPNADGTRKTRAGLAGGTRQGRRKGQGTPPLLPQLTASAPSRPDTSSKLYRVYPGDIPTGLQIHSWGVHRVSDGLPGDHWSSWGLSFLHASLSSSAHEGASRGETLVPPESRFWRVRQLADGPTSCFAPPLPGTRACALCRRLNPALRESRRSSRTLLLLSLTARNCRVRS